MFPRFDYYRPNPYLYGGLGYGFNPYYYPSCYNYGPIISPLPYYVPSYAPITPLQLSYIQNYNY